jgi:hypothetical protein
MQILLVIATVAVITLLIWILQHIKIQSKRQWVSSAHSSDDRLPQPNTLGSTLLNLVLTQMMQSQQDHHQRDLEQFWTAQDPSNDFASFSDNTWDM